MRFLSIACLLIFISTSLFGAHPFNETHGFDLKKANQQFDKINLRLSIQNLDENSLEEAVNTLSTLTAEAEQSIEEIQKRLNNIDLLIRPANANKEDKENLHESVDLIYLDKEKKKLIDQQGQYRLFTIRAKEAITAYKTAIAQMKQEHAFSRGEPLWDIISYTTQAPMESELITLFQSNIPSTLPSFFFSLLFIGISLILSTLILLQLHNSRFARHYLRIRKIHLGELLLLSLSMCAAALCIYLSISLKPEPANNLILSLAKTIFAYLSTLLCILFLFRLKFIKALLYWYSFDGQFFQMFFAAILSFYTLAAIGQLLATILNTRSPLWQLCQSFFELTVLAVGAYFIYRFCHLHHHITFIRKNRHLIQNTGFLLCILCAITDTLGYHTLARHITLSGFLTFTIFFISILCVQSINKIYLIIYSQEPLKNNFIKFFGYRGDQTFTEFFILKIISILMIMALSIYFIGQSWGFASNLISDLYQKLVNGLHLANTTIYPTRIMIGVIIFCLLNLLFRTISTAISNHQQFENEEQTQVAVASILTYIGFCIAIISGLLVAGFDFTGLAIIAGALSVGIGLGLQSIVNNFVSGLILLIEKPIRPGDRINVDGIEGFVKKIRVRSTQIITPSREDIIVPNSDLITRRVTNYMFSDKFCRINCDIGVAYDSNTLLVRDILLNIACHHEEVIKAGRNKPSVMLRSFADDSLIFRLSCLIKDVNKKGLVESELNFAIHETFQDHQIELPYPQRDIHLKFDALPEYIKEHITK